MFVFLQQITYTQTLNITSHVLHTSDTKLGGCDVKQQGLMRPIVERVFK